MMEQDMGSRGVARTKMQEHKDPSKDKMKDMQMGGQDGDMMMSPEQRMDMLQMHQKQTLWVYWLVVILGFWTILSPLTFDYAKQVVMPSGDRSVWISLVDRLLVLKWSDI
ncbi:MAG: vitamin K epoxide reductase, partial [Pedobacter sp.]